MSDDFKLTRALGLEVHHFKFKAVNAEELERVLAKGVRAYGVRHANGEYSFDTHAERKEMPAYDNTALLIGITEIRRESAEDVLRDMESAVSEWFTTAGRAIDLTPILERARRVLGK